MPSDPARHAAALALVFWILFLDTGPDRHGFNEWAGSFSTRQKCEQALSREQIHRYDMSPDELDAHAPGKNPTWVQGLSGFCESSDKVFGTQALSAAPTANQGTDGSLKP